MVKNKKKYFSLDLANSVTGPVAYAPENALLSYELIDVLNNENRIPYDLKIKKVTESKKGLIVNEDLESLDVIWEDYLPNNVGLPLMSGKMKSIIENNLTGNENIDWLTCDVWANDIIKTYFVLRFNVPFDVLDKDKTKYIKGTELIMMPCFSTLKIVNYSVFPKPTTDDLYRISINLYVNEDIKKAIENENLKGIDFGKIKTE